MENDFITKTLQSVSETDPNIKELLLTQAQSEYNKGNKSISVYYQVHALFKAFEDRYLKTLNKEDSYNYNSNYFKQMNKWEIQDFNTNALMQYMFKELNDCNDLDKTNNQIEINENISFLDHIRDPAQGLNVIVDICQQLPKEWTIIQLCKGPRPETSYNTYSKIHESHAALYLTILKHAVSDEYSIPICIKLDNIDSNDIFKKYASIVDRFKEIIIVDVKECETNEGRAKYWKKVNNFDCYLQHTLDDLKNFIYPWNFLFNGISVNERMAYVNLFRRIKVVFKQYFISEEECVIISLAAFHITKIDVQQIYDICNFLVINNVELKESIIKFLVDMREHDKRLECDTQNYPCILIVDDRLDHIFWEEINVKQEFSRVNSLKCLWRLYQQHKVDMFKGYFMKNITDGCCLINPDRNLPKTEMRMRSFFEYWAPNWDINSARKPVQDEFLKKFFQSSCYVYAGHGSGLQYINGKHISKQLIKCVVFLFGCDSSRLHSNGLYSELIGAHLYYHAAMCPSFVGTLMPGLDANMDGIATEILSRWITPNSTDITPWDEVEKIKWSKEGKICPKQIDCDKSNAKILNNLKKYQLPSLCAIVSLIHQRVTDTKYYNTVPYVCRGLPAWNCSNEQLPP